MSGFLIASPGSMARAPPPSAWRTVPLPEQAPGRIDPSIVLAAARADIEFAARLVVLRADRLDAGLGLGGGAGPRSRAGLLGRDVAQLLGALDLPERG